MEHKSYYAVIFISKLSNNTEGYHEMALEMEALATTQKGYLGFESARDTIGVSVSFWETLEDIRAWKHQSEHYLAQRYGKQKWYTYYKVHICKVEREYEFGDFNL
ncbi:MAG: antibiotic biosynthesis monooxygenase [Chitinophagaceae bacterium]